MLIEAKGATTVSEVEKNKKLMKKLDHLPKAEQKKWIKTYTNAYNNEIKKGVATAKAEEYAARTAWDKVPAKFLEEPTKEHGPGKSKKPLAAYKEAFLKETEDLVKEGTKVSDNILENFFMWAEANDLDFVAAEDAEIKKEFTPEEQEFLKTVTGYGVKKKEGGFTVCLHGADPDAGSIEIEVSDDGETIEEEMEEEKEEILEEGVE